MPVRDREKANGAAPANGGASRVAAPAGGQMGFDQFMELIPDAMLAIDEAGAIVNVNGQAERLFGYPRNELLGAEIGSLIPERFSRAHARHRERAFQGDLNPRPMGLGLNLFGRRKDGSEFPADISFSAVRVAGGLLGVAAVRDLTKRVEAQKERAALEAEAREGQARRLESIGELAGGIAHDFNNLLAVILNNTELVLDTIEVDADQEQELREVYDAADCAAKLTRQLLVFSKQEAAKHEAVDLNAIVEGIEQLLKRSLGEHIEMELSVADELPPVLGDPSQIEQVLMNLAINARDAMPEGGLLGIRTDDVELDLEYVETRPDVIPGRYARLTVSDTGTGMPPDVVERALEPFFTTKPTGEGTGLGLATVYGIVKQCDGHLAIYSEEGNGTVMRVYLPYADEPAAASPKQAEESAKGQGQGQTILVVEDSDRVRRTVCRILTANGYRVVETSRATQALKLLEAEKESVDLVLTDMVMPGMLGTELAERLASFDQSLPVLLMSGYNDVSGPIEDDMLVEKPFTSRTLLGAIQRALEKASR